MPALATIQYSLRDYGHEDIQLIFTDCVKTDKAELERIFTCLHNNVEPIPAASSLPHFTIPSDLQPTILETPFTVTARLNYLMESLQGLPENQCLDVAMDMEWSVNITEGYQGRVALVSIAFSKTIYLIRVRIKFTINPLP